MARRHNGHMNGQRFLANASPSKREVHDLDNEKTGSTECQIDKIIAAGHDRPYDSLAQAQAAGYDNCNYCVGNSRR
jgi:hypothetical protein